jgi:hypothetical protein
MLSRSELTRVVGFELPMSLRRIADLQIVEVEVGQFLAAKTLRRQLESDWLDKNSKTTLIRSIKRH